MIRIQRLMGLQSGMATTHAEPRLTFGRDPRNTVAIEDEHVSRLHGELVLHEGRWLLINRSANGTTLNGRQTPEGRPVEVRAGDVVGVGDLQLFSVQFSATALGPQAPEAHADEAPKPPGVSRRTKLWIGIGIYMAVMLVGIVVFMTAVGPAKKPGSGGLPDPMTAEKIAAEIRQPIKVDLPDARAAEGALEQARNWYPRLGGAPDALYRTHRAYKLCLAYSAKRQLEGIDQLRYQEVEERLVNKVTHDYASAYARLANKEMASAENAFRQLMNVYPDTQSKILDSIRDQLLYIESLKPRKNTFR